MDFLFLFPSNFIKICFFLSVGSGHIESSINYRWQVETGELIACNNPVFEVCLGSVYFAEIENFLLKVS